MKTLYLSLHLSEALLPRAQALTSQLCFGDQYTPARLCIKVVLPVMPTQFVSGKRSERQGLRFAWEVLFPLK